MDEVVKDIVEDIGKIERRSARFLVLHSYLMYFVLLLVGMALDTIFKFKIFNDAFMVPIGIVILVSATVFIFWTEYSTHNELGENINKESFCRGPYCYTRSPIHLGLFLLMLGFGITINAFFVILTTCISYLIGRFVFHNQTEKLLEKKFGTHYIEYKKSVKF